MTHSSVQNQREVIFLFASPPTPADRHDRFKQKTDLFVNDQKTLILSADYNKT